MASDVLQVCISCRYHPEQRFQDGKRGGFILFQELDSRIKNSSLKLELKTVECLSACRNHCALAFTGQRKMTMVFGRLNVHAELEATCDALLDYASLYGTSSDGAILRADRPPILQDKLLVRVPPAEGLARLGG